MDEPADFSYLEVRRRLGRELWAPPRPHGPSGVVFMRRDGRRSLIVSSARMEDRVIWLHASISAQPSTEPVPEYAELAAMRAAVWGTEGWAFQVFAPPYANVNIRVNALHLWGRLDGARTHPDFGRDGSI